MQINNVEDMQGSNIVGAKKKFNPLKDDLDSAFKELLDMKNQIDDKFVHEMNSVANGFLSSFSSAMSAEEIAIQAQLLGHTETV